EALRIAEDEDLLCARRRGAPEPHPVVVVVVGVHHEHLFVAHKPGRLPVAESLRGLRQREADLAQPLEWVSVHSAAFCHTRSPGRDAKPAPGSKAWYPRGRTSGPSRKSTSNGSSLCVVALRSCSRCAVMSRSASPGSL